MIDLIGAHWLLAVGWIGTVVVSISLGWSARIMWREWKDDRALRAAEARYERASERHTHRKGDPQETTLLELPRAGYLEPLPDLERPTLEPPWLFAGESAPGWGSESAEYELLTQPAPLTTPEELGLCPDCLRAEDYCACGPMPGELLTQTTEQPASVTGEPPIDTGELLAITDRVESWIAQWTAQGNIDRHTIQAGDS